MKYGHWPLRIDSSTGSRIVYMTIAPDAPAQAVRDAALNDALPFINTPDGPDIHIICDNPAQAAAFILGAALALGGREVIVNGRVAQERPKKK